VDIVAFTFLIGGASAAAGFLGSLTGLGGGVVIVPLLTLVFKVNIHYAIGASLVSVIATSSGAAAAYVRDGFTNIRVGMFLEIATTLGAILGAYLIIYLSPSLIAVIFACVLVYSAYSSFRDPEPDRREDPPDEMALQLRMNGAYPVPDGFRRYRVSAIPLGFGLSAAIGILSGLLGIGAGALKVMVMERFMRIPFKVSAATSNFMIGVTAASSVGVYLGRGYIDPALAMPVMLGVTAGSWLGAHLLFAVQTESLRRLFACVILGLAVEMFYYGITGSF
jgi:uncharacterized membrane protein YfcA